MRCALFRQLLPVSAACLFVLSTLATSRADSFDATALGPSNESIHSFGTGKGRNTVDLLFGSCYHKDGMCSTPGVTMGPGADQGRYILKITSPVVFPQEGTGDWAASTLPDRVSFCYGRDCDLLSGTLALLQFKDSGQSGSLTFAFKATGGSMENLFAHSHGGFALSLNNPSPLNPASLIRAHVSETFSGGILTPVPEPTSFALLGSGLLGLAGKIRHKLNS